MLKRLFQSILKQDSFFRKRAWKFGKVFTFACFLFVFLLAAHSALTATGPSIITYQGKLLESGSSVTTTKAMKFVIYDASTGGTAVYTAAGALPTTSTINVTPTNGIFSVDLGGNGTNSLSESVFNASELWLEVTVGGTTLSPRKRLTSVPFAVNSARLNGVAATSTASTSTYIPISGSDGSFTFNTTTVAYLFGTTVSTTDLVVGNSLTLGGETRTSWPSGGSGSSLWTSSTGLVYPATVTDVVLIGTNTTSTADSILEVNGTSILGETYVQGLTLGRGSGGNFSNTVFGYEAFASNTTGYHNVALGVSALELNTTGYQNTAVGLSALAVNQTGYLNTAIGYGALSSNTSAFNTAVGAAALFNNVSGNYNTAVGLYALLNNVGGGSNTALGARALVNSTGSRNTAVGRDTLDENTSGGDNTAVGYRALSANNTGQSNTALGSDSLISIISGNYNVGIGDASGAGITTGSYNTVIGADAPILSLGITTGSYNTIIGAQVNGLTSTLSNNIILADGEGNQRIRVLSNGYVGINTTTPAHQFTVQGDGFLTGTVTSTELVATGGITLGGVRRTSWPSGGGGDALFADGGGYLYPATTTYPVVIGANVTSTDGTFEVQGDSSFVGTTNLTSTTVFLNGLGSIYTTSSMPAGNGNAAIFDIGSGVDTEHSGLILLRGNNTNPAGFMINNNGGLNDQAILLTVENGNAALKLGRDNTYGSIEIYDENDQGRIFLSGTSTFGSFVAGNIYLGQATTTESITTSSFVMNGDDAYVADLLGVGDSLYVENEVHIGTSSLHLSGDVSGGEISMTGGPLTIDSAGRLNINTTNAQDVYIGGFVGIGEDDPSVPLAVSRADQAFTAETLAQFYVVDDLNGMVAIGNNTTGNGSFGGLLHGMSGHDSVSGLKLVASTPGVQSAVIDGAMMEFRVTQHSSIVSSTTGFQVDLFQFSDGTTELLDIRKASGSYRTTIYGALDVNELSRLATTTINGLLTINGGISGLSSSDLSDASSLAYLSNTQTFTGANTFSGITTLSTTTIGAGGTGNFNVFGTATFNTTTDVLGSFDVDSGLLFADVDSGRVGINTTTPEYTLAVDGTTNITGNTTIGGSLTVSNTSTFLGRVDMRGNAINPVAAATYQDATQTDGALAMTFIDEYLYLGGYKWENCTNCDNNLLIFDISNPNDPSLVEEINNGDFGINIGQGLWKMRRAGDMLYALRSGFQNNETDAILIIDVSNPVAPTQINILVDGEFTDMEGLTDLQIEGNYLYVTAGQDDALLVIDISDPYNPVYVSRITNADPNTLLDDVLGIDIKGRYAYTVARGTQGTGTDADGLTVIDISDPYNPVGVTTLPHGTAGAALADPWEIEIVGNLAYIASANGSNLQIVNISNPESPIPIGKTGAGDTTALNGLLSINVSGNYIYGVAQHGGLSVIDATDPTAPFVVFNQPSGLSPLLSTAIRLATHGGFVYVASLGQNFGTVTNGTGGLQVFDIRSVHVVNTGIGSARISRLDVDTYARFNNQVEIGGGLTIGRNGLLVRGDASFGGHTSNGNTATTTLTFSNTALFQSTASTTATNTYIFNTRNTISNGSSIVSIRNNNTNLFDIFGNGYVGINTTTPSARLTVDGDALFTDTVTSLGDLFVGSGTETITTSSFVLDGDDAYIHDLLGVGDSLYVENNVYIGTSTLRLNGNNSGGVISMTNGPLTLDSSGQLNINTTNNSNVLFGSGNVAIGTSTVSHTFTLDGTARFFGTSTFADVLIGGSSETLSNTGFVMNGDDLFVADKLGVEGILYNDGGIRMASGTRLQIGNESGGLFDARLAVDGPVYATGSFITTKGVVALDGLVVDGNVLFGSDTAGTFVIHNNPDIRGTTTLRNTNITATSTLDVNGTFEMNLYDGVISTEAVCMDTTLNAGNNIKLGDCDGAPGDLAEVYEAEVGVAAGHIVMTTGRTISYEERLYDPITGQPILKAGTQAELGVAQKSDQATKQTTIAVVDKAHRNATTVALGVVSTNPNQTIGKGAADVATNPKAVAIVGRVPVRVNLQNGPIAIGDAITVSDEPGVGMKAGSGDPTIGIALASYTGGGSGTVMVALMSGQYGLLERIALLEAELATFISGGDMTTMDVTYDPNSGTVQSLSGSLQLNGSSIFGVRSIRGFADAWQISESGFFVTTIETSEGTKDLYALQSEQSEIVLSGSGQLTSGVAEIQFEAVYEEIIDATQPIKISVTLTDEAKGIYVTDKSVRGFSVRELQGGTSDATFDWVAIVYRGGIEHAIVTPEEQDIDDSVSSEGGSTGEESTMENTNEGDTTDTTSTGEPSSGTEEDSSVSVDDTEAVEESSVSSEETESEETTDDDTEQVIESDSEDESSASPTDSVPVDTIEESPAPPTSPPSSDSPQIESNDSPPPAPSDVPTDPVE